MTELPCRYDITVTITKDGGTLPDPGDYARRAGLAASSRAATIMSAHTAEKLISVVTVEAPDRPAAVAVAMAVVSEGLRRPVSSSSR